MNEAKIYPENSPAELFRDHSGAPLLSQILETTFQVMQQVSDVTTGEDGTNLFIMSYNFGVLQAHRIESKDWFAL